MIKFKKPPDKIVTVKCPLKLILKDDKYTHTPLSLYSKIK